MEDLILITAHCPTEEQEKALENCIDSALKCGKHIALISHSHVPVQIQKKCQFYVYDYNNEVSSDPDLIGFNSFSFLDKIIQSKFFDKTFYGFAIYRMFSIASQIAINFGYKNIHHIEYDCELLDTGIVEENSKLLEEYDSLLYTNTGNSDGFIFGSFKSFRVSSLPDSFKRYNREFINDQMRMTEPKYLETFTKKIFVDSGKVLFRKPPLDKFKKGVKFYNKKAHFTLFYDPSNNTLNLFYQSMKQCSEKIVAIVNKNKIVSFEAKPNHWNVKPLGVFDDISYVRIDNSEEVIYEKEFKDNERESFKINSYVLDIE
jgi:hypothetical protein